MGPVNFCQQCRQFFPSAIRQIEVLKHTETARLRIFTFGGGSFIAPGKSHSDFVVYRG